MIGGVPCLDSGGLSFQDSRLLLRNLSCPARVLSLLSLTRTIATESGGHKTSVGVNDSFDSVGRAVFDLDRHFEISTRSDRYGVFVVQKINAVRTPRSIRRRILGPTDSE